MKRIIALFLVMVLSCSFPAVLQIGVISTEASDIITKDIMEGVETEISFTSRDREMYFGFVPKESGWYKFYSTGYCDVEGNILNAAFTEELAASDNYQKDFFGRYVITGNFKLIHYFEAGRRYVLRSAPTDSEGTYYVGVEKVPKATAMTILKQEVVDVGIGEEYALRLCFTPEDCEQEKITWVSDNPDSVFIDEDGICHFKTLGTANVTATTESGLTDSIVVNVVNYPDILLNNGVEQSIGGDETVKYTFTPDSNGTYEFSVISNSGMIQNVPVFIEVYDKDYNLIAESDDVSSEESVYCDMNAGEHYYLTYTAYSDHVFATGTAKVKRVGKPTGGFNTTDELLQEGEDIALEDVKEIRLGEEKQIEIPYYFAKSVHKFTPTEDGEYKFSAYGNESVFFNVLSDKFIGVGSGNAPFRMKLEAGKTYVITSNISGSENSGMGEYSIEITKLPKAEKIDITNGERLVGYIRDQEKLNVGYTPEECETEKFKWTSSDESVVEVVNGNIYMKKVGKATVTVTSENGFTDSIEVEVIHYPEIKVDKPISFVSDRKEATFRFIPDTTGIYNFVAEAEDAEMLLNVEVAKESSKPDITVLGKQLLQLGYQFNAGEVYNITIKTDTSDALGAVVYSVEMDSVLYESGDVNRDCIKNAEDALLVLKVAAKLETLSDEVSMLADVNTDSSIDATDALNILKIAAKLE